MKPSSPAVRRRLAKDEESRSPESTPVPARRLSGDPAALWRWLTKYSDWRLVPRRRASYHPRDLASARLRADRPPDDSDATLEA